MNISENLSITTTSSAVTIDLSTHQLYIAFGTMALVCNLIVAVILLRNREFMNKSAFISGLCLADISNGCSLIVTGALRLTYALQGTLYQPVSPFVCLIRVTIIWTAASELTALAMLLIGSERLIATVCFKWYYTNWSNKKAWILTGVAYAYSACTISALSIFTYIGRSIETTPQQCFAPSVIGPIYTWYDYMLSIGCGTFGILGTVISLIIFTNKRRKFKTNVAANGDSGTNNLQQFLTGQWNLTITLTIVAFCDFTLVVIPNILKLVGSFYPPLLVVGFYGSYMVGTRSALSIIIYTLSNKDFRLTLFRVVGLNTATSSVSPN